MISFNGQRPDETVRLVSRQHPVVLLPPFLVAGLLLMLPVMALSFLNNGALLSSLFVIGPLLAALRLASSIYCYRTTLVLVSTERVAYFQQAGIFKRVFYECPTSAVVQVSHEVQGAAATIFGYGTVIVNTGDAASSIFVRRMPDPFGIQQDIQEVIGR